jgi:tRNA(Arg) A34 adenosine deaminase TadA
MDFDTDVVLRDPFSHREVEAIRNASQNRNATMKEDWLESNDENQQT